MTLIVGIVCSDGVVIAADSATSDTESGTKQPTEKIERIGNHPILYGGSGDVGLLQKLAEALKGLTTKTPLKRIRQDIKKLVVPELKESIALHVPYPRQIFHEPPPATLLLVGVTDRHPWILEIEKDGRDTFYGEDLGNFAAIGSGKSFAQAIFRPHLKTPRDLNLGKTFAYRIIDDSIELSVMGLCHPVNIFTISLDGTIVKIDAGEMEGVKTQCELWRSLEREAVGKILAPKTVEEQPSIPTPETSPGTQI